MASKTKAKTKKVVINTCYGGFSLSDEAYEWLIAHGVRVGKYVEEKPNPKTGMYDKKPPENEGEVIFDNELTHKGENTLVDLYHEHKGNSRLASRYWETFINDEKRDWPLLVQCVEELKSKANGPFAQLKVVKIPADVEYTIEEYDGSEHIAEKHEVWS